MRKGGTSHKKNSCAYHDLANSEEGEMINSMDQVGEFENVLIFGVEIAKTYLHNTYIFRKPCKLLENIKLCSRTN